METKAFKNVRLRGVGALAGGRGRHSAKPQQVRERIMRLSPPPYLELFGRRVVKDWVVFGNQVEEELI